MKKLLYVFFILVLLVAMPVLIGRIVSIGIVDWLVVDNDWIGFWGGYLGGLLTLVGVIITIKYMRADSDEKQRMSVIPYISVDHNVFREYDRKDVEFGLSSFCSEKRSQQHILYFDEILMFGSLKNVGLGPAINCSIKEVQIGKRNVMSATSKISVLIIGETSIFILEYNQIGFSAEQLGKELVDHYNQYWINGNIQLDVPELTVKFSLCFEDVMGNKYRQKVIFSGQLEQPQEDAANTARFLFQSIDKPELYTEK